MNKIPCEIIQDLLPSFIDELTSDVTNREVEAHIEECEQCRNIFRQMKTPDIETAENEEKEIDFLKKTKKKHRRNLILSVAVVWAIAVLFFCARYYLEFSPENEKRGLAPLKNQRNQPSNAYFGRSNPSC